jgi:DNA-binding MarR family transcriptional regulator
LCDRDKAAVSRIITEMKNKGLICWENENESRYRARLMLTDEGKKAAEYVSGRAKAAAAIVNEKLDEEQRKAMYATLDLFSESLQNIVREGLPDFD